MDKIKELEVLCKPIVEFIRKNYDPYVSVVVTDTNIKLTRDIAGVPQRCND